MRDRPHPNHKLEWPGGVVPEWAKPAQGKKKPAAKSIKPAAAKKERKKA